MCWDGGCGIGARQAALIMMGRLVVIDVKLDMMEDYSTRFMSSILPGNNCSLSKIPPSTESAFPAETLSA